ncbi:MAG: bifunctional demethylmenaquinone methyltransferase/2-methoxy-6-polyprenyl-1,4-benzoquinol methylase UbiE [Bdellovibrio sp.]
MDQFGQTRKLESFKIFDQIAPTYDRLNRILSVGIDIYWRQVLKRHLPKRNELKVLDLATGTGDVPLTLIKDKKVQTIVGTDLSEGMLTVGRKKISEKNLTDRITLKVGDGVTIPESDESFDVITVSFGIRNFPDYEQSLRNMKRVLKKNGRAMVLELSMPKNPLIKMFYQFYFRFILPLIGNGMSNHGDAYTYLNKTVESFPSGEEFASLMKKAGFVNVDFKPLTFGIATLYWGDKT